MKLPHRPSGTAAAAAAAAASAAVLTLALSAPAQAATGWVVAFTHHYGVATNYSAISAVAAVSADDAWAFGTTNEGGEPAPGAPVAEHWNGTAWSRSALPSGLTSEIVAASVVSADSVWAVTQVGGDILHWNGSTWSVADQVPGSDLLFTGITAVNNHDVWAFGSSSVGPGVGTWHFNGSTWSQVNGSAVGLVSASALSAKDIWALGSSSRGPAADRVEHYTGTTWTPVSTPVPSGWVFGGITAISDTDVWAAAQNVSGGGGAVLVHYDGTKWTSITVPYADTNLGAFTPDGHGGFWLDAYDSRSATWVMHYPAGGKWSRSLLGSGGMGPITLVPGTTSLWAGGTVPTTSGANARVWSHA